MIISKYTLTKDHLVINIRHTANSDINPYIETEYPNALSTNAIAFYTTANVARYYSNSYIDDKLEWNRYAELKGPQGETFPAFNFSNLKGYGMMNVGDANTDQVIVFTKSYISESISDNTPRPGSCVEEAAGKENEYDGWDILVNNSDDSFEFTEQLVISRTYDIETSAWNSFDPPDIEDDDLNIDWDGNENF